MAEAGAKKTRWANPKRIKEIYKRLEGLTFKAISDGDGPMKQFYLRVPRRRPVYSVMDTSTNNVLEEIYRNMKTLEREYEGEIWKGITISDRGTYKLWGTEHSVDVSSNGVYHIPSDGVEVIANRTMNYLAVVNITVEKGRLLVCPFIHFIRLFQMRVKFPVQP